MRGLGERDAAFGCRRPFSVCA